MSNDLSNLIIQKLEKLDDKLDDLQVVVATNITNHELRISTIEKAHDRGSPIDRAGIAVAVIAVIISMVTAVASCGTLDGLKTHEKVVKSVKIDAVHPDTFGSLGTIKK